MVMLIERVVRLEIQVIRHGDELPNYPHIDFHAWQRTSHILEELKRCLENERGVQKLGQLIGQEPALAYAVKNMAEVYIFPQLKALVACYFGLKEKRALTLVWDPGCPESWYEAIQEEMREIPFNFYRWPPWQRRLHGLCLKLGLLFSLALQTLGWFLRRGVRKQKKPQAYKVVTEFVDPKRLGGTAYDNDYWVDGQRLRAEETLFFLTHRQRKICAGNGYELSDLVNLVQDKGYHLAVLDRLPYSCQSALKLAALLGRLFGLLGQKESPAAVMIFTCGWQELMEFLPLFEYFRARDFIYLTHPNGDSNTRHNDAIITGLCRLQGIRSVGCQTRGTISYSYVECFDCFDIYLQWGPAWHAAFPPGMQFIKETHTVGCIYLDTLLPRFRQHCPSQDRNHRKTEKNELVVSVFPSDVSNHYFFTLGYAKRFLINCAKMAAKYPDTHFLVKMKDPKDINKLNDDPGFKQALTAMPNFEFVKQERFDYANVLGISDIVIAIGFTTPGAEGLLLGKRAIFYSEMPYAGLALRHFLNLIANDPEEFEEIFQEAMSDYRDYGSANAAKLSLLDPFRDGAARPRILTMLGY